MATDGFSRVRLDSVIDMRHPPAVLATRMPWAGIEASLAPLLAHQGRGNRLVCSGAPTKDLGRGLERGVEVGHLRVVRCLHARYAKHQMQLLRRAFPSTPDTPTPIDLSDGP